MGTPTVAADAEICMMLADALEAVGIARGDYLVRINNRKVLNGVMEAIGLWSADDAEAGVAARGTVLRAVDKLDRLGEEGVRALLGPGRKDESGDFTRGAGLTDAQADLVMGFVAARRETAAGTCARLAELVGGSATGAEGVAELETIAGLVEAQGYADRMVIDPSVVRGLGYYTGPVYEAELTFEITDEAGNRAPVRLGRRRRALRRSRQALHRRGGAGDRHLDRRRPTAGGADAPSAGREPRTAAGPVVILAMDRAEMAAYQTMCAELRRAGIRAEVFLGGGNMARQLKYADRRAAPVAVIEGGDERAAGQVTLKDLALGARLAAEIETHDEWKAQPAQITVPRAELVEQVRAHARPGPADAGAARDRARRWRRSRARWRRSARVFAEAGHAPVAVPYLYLGETLLDLYGEDLRARAFLVPGCRARQRAGAPPRLHRPRRAGARRAWLGAAGGLPLSRAGLPHAGAGARPADRIPSGRDRALRRRRPGGRRRRRLRAALARAGGARRRAGGDDRRPRRSPSRCSTRCEMPAAPARRAAAPLLAPCPLPGAGRAAPAGRPAPRPSAGRWSRRWRAEARAAAVDGADAGGGRAGRQRASLPRSWRARRRLAAEPDEPPMPAADARLIADGAGRRGSGAGGGGPAAAASPAPPASAIAPAIDRFEARLAALEAQGIDDGAGWPSTPAFGRNLEYYDGFVFELRAPGGAPTCRRWPAAGAMTR